MNVELMYRMRSPYLIKRGIAINITDLDKDRFKNCSSPWDYFCWVETIIPINWYRKYVKLFYPIMDELEYIKRPAIPNRKKHYFFKIIRKDICAIIDSNPENKCISIILFKQYNNGIGVDEEIAIYVTNI